MVRFITRTAFLAVVGMGLASSTATQAAPMIFFGQDLNADESVRLASFPNASAARASFLSNLTGVGTETFESFATNAAPPLVLSFPGAGTATLTGAGVFVNSVPSGTSAGRYPISGTKYVEGSSASLLVSFSAPVAAFGFYATDVGDFSGRITLTLTRPSGTETFTVPSAININGGSVLYYGIIDAANPFTSVTFGNTAAGSDFFGFDDMTIGSVQQVTPVPEPTTLASMTLGAVLLGFASRRARRRKA
jgi:hypothetical protein